MIGRERNRLLDRHITDFVESGTRVENIRDIWYHIKHDIEYLEEFKAKSTDWDEYVNIRIGEKLWNIFLNEDIYVYRRLNLITKALDNVSYEYNTPIVIFSEKQTRAIDNACEALLCGKFYSTGQIPSFEVAQLAFYLSRLDGDEAHLYMLADYDPAGISIMQSLVDKLTLALDEVSQDKELIIHQVKYGETYPEIIQTYDSFTLSTNPKNTFNQKWIRAGQTKGVELNVMHDKREKLDDLILSTLPPEIVKTLSYERAVSDEIDEREENDKKLQRLIEKVEKRKRKIEKKVRKMDAEFSDEWIEPLTYKNVTVMTKLEVVVAS